MVERRKGTYGALKYSHKTIADLERWMADHGIPNKLDVDKIHTTLIYSRVKLHEMEQMGKTNASMLSFKPIGFGIFNSALVLLIDAPELVELHESLKKEFGATHDYEDYRPHVTLSYGIDEGFDLSSLNLPSFDLQPSIIYFEALNTDWMS